MNIVTQQRSRKSKGGREETWGKGVEKEETYDKNKYVKKEEGYMPDCKPIPHCHYKDFLRRICEVSV